MKTTNNKSNIDKKFEFETIEKSVNIEIVRESHIENSDNSRELKKINDKDDGWDNHHGDIIFW
jgi:hypothetical protein